MSMPEPMLPVLHTLEFSVVIADEGNLQWHQHDIANAVRNALIAVLPPGTGVAELSCQRSLNDAYYKKDRK